MKFLLKAKLEPELKDFIENFDFLSFKEVYSVQHIVFPDIIERKIKELKKELRDEDEIYFAMKSTISKSLISKLLEFNCGLDVSTTNELKLARKLACKKILAGGPKSKEYLYEALKFAQIISVDSIYELNEIIASQKKANILIRINDLSVFNRELEYKRSKFGIRSSQIKEFLEIIKKSNSEISIIGIHFHSDGYSPEERALFFNHIFNLYKFIKSYGHPISKIDLGGSFNEELLENPLEFEDFIRFNMDLVKKFKESYFLNNSIYNLEFNSNTKTFRGIKSINSKGIKKNIKSEIKEMYETECIDQLSYKELLSQTNLSLIIEPGTALSTNCGISIFSVQGKKSFDDNNKYLVLNGHKFNISANMFDYIPNPLFLQFNSKKNLFEISKEIDFELRYIVGSLCREDDFLLLRKVIIPKSISSKDLVLFPNTGSYAMTYENCNPQRSKEAKYLYAKKINNSWVLENDN